MPDKNGNSTLGERLAASKAAETKAAATSNDEAEADVPAKPKKAAAKSTAKD